MIFILIIMFIILIYFIIQLILKKPAIKPDGCPEKGIMKLSPRGNKDKCGKTCNIDITDNCSCTVIDELSEDETTKSKPLNSYEIEKNYYKIKQDLIPLWSDWGTCELLNSTVYTKTRFNLTNTYNEDNTCDMIKCKNLGALKTENKFNIKCDNNEEVCELKKRGNNKSVIKYDINTQTCIPYNNLTYDILM